MNTGKLAVVLIAWCLVGWMPLTGQDFVSMNKQNGIVCRVEGDRLVFSINLKQTWASLVENAARFDVDTAVLRQAIEGIPAIITSEAVWTAQKTGTDILLLSKALWPDPPEDAGSDVVMVDEGWFKSVENTIHQPVANFGVNRFADPEVFGYHDGLVTFMLKGERKARKVMLSGTFNNWSTMHTRMEKTEKGWSITFPLKPGEYEYKYIVDGNWTIDPENYNRRDNEAGSQNSVVFVYNHRFFLEGYSHARRVMVGASFNGWSDRGLRMTKTAAGWELPLWVREGTHAYKFIVDGKWILDPKARVNRPDGKGNENSFFSIGDTMIFRLRGYTTARKVVLSGNFNAWNHHELQMIPTGSGWELPYVLAPGTYEYKFIVDGKWMADPDNPFNNSSKGDGNSILVVSPNYAFRLKGFPDAREVFVSGTFNGWAKPGYRMYKKEGDWLLPVYLTPGKYSYKFIVNGRWILDPANKLWEQNEYNTGNSVLWIER